MATESRLRLVTEDPDRDLGFGSVVARSPTRKKYERADEIPPEEYREAIGAAINGLLRDGVVGEGSAGIRLRE